MRTRTRARARSANRLEMARAARMGREAERRIQQARLSIARSLQ